MCWRKSRPTETLMWGKQNDPVTLKNILNRLKSLTVSYKVMHTLTILVGNPLSEMKTHVHIMYYM